MGTVRGIILIARSLYTPSPSFLSRPHIYRSLHSIALVSQQRPCSRGVQASHPPTHATPHLQPPHSHLQTPRSHSQNRRTHEQYAHISALHTSPLTTCIGCAPLPPSPPPLSSSSLSNRAPCTQTIQTIAGRPSRTNRAPPYQPPSTPHQQGRAPP